MSVLWTMEGAAVIQLLVRKEDVKLLVWIILDLTSAGAAVDTSWRLMAMSVKVLNYTHIKQQIKINVHGSNVPKD